MSDIKKLLSKDYSELSVKNLYTFKRHWAKQIGRIPKDSEVLEAYKELVKDGTIKPSKRLEKLLQTRGVRSISGVTPFAVMTKPYICPGRCTYCPLELGMPKSYLSDEPAAQRAKKFDFDPKLQILNRLEQLEATGHETDKIELIVIGGTFSNYPAEYKIEFFKEMFDAINGQSSTSLEEAQQLNESASRRIVGISIETRPDWIDEKEVKLLRRLGVTKLQVGVQALDEQILENIRRGHSLDAVAKATLLLRNAGFKICYHFMPNLPGSDPDKDIEMARLMFEDPRFKPDFVKIYPAQVIPGTELHRQWERGEHRTYPDDEMLKVLKAIKLITPTWCRIDRLVRDISKKWVASGTHKSNMRQFLQDELSKEGKECVCIRCREIKELIYDKKPQMLTTDMQTAGGADLMISYEGDGNLYSILKLRLPDGKQDILFPELAKAAIIREVHTFGQAVPVDTHEEEKTQHRGLGRELIQEAENIAKERGYKRIAVISSIGTRNYYRKLGYERDGLYMTKQLSN